MAHYVSEVSNENVDGLVDAIVSAVDGLPTPVVLTALLLSYLRLQIATPTVHEQQAFVYAVSKAIYDVIDRMVSVPDCNNLDKPIN